MPKKLPKRRRRDTQASIPNIRLPPAPTFLYAPTTPTLPNFPVAPSPIFLYTITVLGRGAAAMSNRVR